MPDTVFLPDRIEVTRPIPAPPAAIFDIVRSPAGHVAIDASGMLQDFTGEPAEKVGDTFVIHMDRESLNDFPLGKYDVTVHIIVFERDKEIAWNLGPDIPVPHFYGYRLEAGEDGVTNVTSYYDWSKVERRPQGAIPDRSGVGSTCHAGHLGANGPKGSLTRQSDKTEGVDQQKSLVRDGYDRIASSYLEARPNDGGDVRLLEELIAELPARSRVLDAGCGSGVPVSSRLLAAGHHVVGMDFSSAQLSLAQTVLTRYQLVQGDLTELPFADGTFDAVVSFYAIIHVPREAHGSLLEEIRRVLRPNGWTLLCLGWGDLPADLDVESWLGVPMFWSHFDQDTNRGLLSEVGFTLR